jgi:DNA-binding SARP family transcriptional activator
LGTTQIRDRDGCDVDPRVWRTSKTFDLLRVLALHAGNPVSMDTLLEQFWPDADPARGRGSLRTAVSHIRKVLGHDSVVRVGTTLALEDVAVDVADYRALASRVDELGDDAHQAQIVMTVREAEKIYRGDIDVAGTECTLLHQARADLQLLRANLLLEAAEAAAQCAAWQQSLAFAGRAAAIETSDRSTRALMRAWFAVGETAKPVEEFERLRLHLAEEYGVDPAPQTRALYLEVVSACTEWPPREMTIGREDEVRQVVTAITGWLMDPDGPSGVVWLVGDPGSGRESVAREAARVLMLPLLDEDAEPGEGATIELLPDQGTLTKGLATTLHLRATTYGRIMVVPVSEASARLLGEDEAEAVVRIPPLNRSDFDRLMALTLQGRPTPELAKELYEEADGLPGLGCRLARRRLRDGTLAWAPNEVDSLRKSKVRTRIMPALAAVPLLFLELFGGGGGMVQERVAQGMTILEERSFLSEERWRLVPA